MSQPQLPIQPDNNAELPLDVQEMQFWLDKAVAWGQADSPETQKDTCQHSSQLREFLQLLLTHISNMSSTTEAMRKMSFLGQFLGRLCWNHYVTCDATSRRLLFQCLWGLYSDQPSNAVERKANHWIRKLLCQLTTEEDDATGQTIVKYLGVPQKVYHLKVLKKMVSLLLENIGNSCGSFCNPSQRCSCDSVLATSERCVPLVTCSEAAPLISALLQRTVTCVKAALSIDFLDAVSSAYSRQCLSLDEQAVIALWCHSLSSLEAAVLTLLESVLANVESTPEKIEQQIAQSLLPKACAQHCSVFLVVNDIFRSILKHTERSEVVRFLIQNFTSSFLRELALLQPQKCTSLKVFFPQSPQHLLIPLLTQTSEMLPAAWRHHLNWLSGSLQRLTEDEEEIEVERSSSGQCTVFEAWFLLVQCAHWVQLAVQLLVTSGPEDCDPLLWLLTFYYHPTNRGHHRAQQLVHASEAWHRLHSLVVVSARPLPVDRLQALAALPSPQQPSLDPPLILSLLINFAVFSHLPLSGLTEVLHTVVHRSGAVGAAAFVFGSLELRLNRGSDTNTARLRIKALQNILTHTDAV